MLARRPVRARAPAELDLALVEVLLELTPLVLGNRGVFLGRAQAPPGGEVSLIVPHHVFVEHGDVAAEGIEVEVPEQCRADMDRE
ncbi:hypothetical protein [Nocardia araoensis]|uniref:hypothetical protein n=1 Tax=Nocardia araoensis TaxID=228600 RepID=UPI001C3F4449|nr:hypothetical protein [Nocardia araoensis]